MKNFAKLVVVVIIIGIFGTGCESGTGKGQMEMIEYSGKPQRVVQKKEMEVPVSTQPQMVTIIGDSITLGASGEILSIMPECIIDAKKSRQVEEGIEIAQNLKAQGLLGDIVIIALGTNGSFSDEVAAELLACIGEERTIYWVTAYGTNLSWKDEVNAKIKNLSKKYDNIYILDWEQVASEHNEWFCEDGIHLTIEGQAGFAKFIMNSF